MLACEASDKEKGIIYVDQITTLAANRNVEMNNQLRDELQPGDWEALFRTASDWLTSEPGQPVANFIKHIAIVFINPPSMIQNKRYLTDMGRKEKDKEWEEVVRWFKDFYTEADQHNPYFQLINFILLPAKKKVAGIESALQDNPNNSELLFMQALALRNHATSIEKLQQALLHKPEFPAALYMLGIYSLELNQVQEAERYLKRTIELSPDFLEAHYQLGSLYSLYIPDAGDQAKIHFEKVVQLDPDGGAGNDAKKVLETNAQPQYGQRVGPGPSTRRGGMSILTILGISLLAVWIFAYPVSSLFKFSNPLAVGVLAGMFVFIGLYMANSRRMR